jgi:DNA polymerase-3 subunit epsilon
MRQIILDTETTGMDPLQGDRLVEIGCVEMVNQVRTDRTYHQYLNPERDVPMEAVAVHGLSTEFLKNHPTFSEVVEEFLAFIGDAELIIHNASFDLKFLNAELAALGYKPIAHTRVIDSLLLARQKFPGAPASLDALCKRFNVDNSGRQFHGALLDAELLADVYIELLGGRQRGIFGDDGAEDDGAENALAKARKKKRQKRDFAVSGEELAAHAAMLQKMKNPLWLKGVDE